MLPLAGIVRSTMAMTSGSAVTAMEQLVWRILIRRILSVSSHIDHHCLIAPCGDNLIEEKDYKNAVEWIQQQIESNTQYQTDDTRFWVDVTAI